MGDTADIATLAGSPATWDPKQVSDFLRSLHLENLVEKFALNAISGTDLLELSDDDLANHLDMTPLQIRKVRAGLAQHGAPAAAPPAAAPPAVAPRAAPAAPAAPAPAAAPAAAVPLAAATAAGEPDPSTCFERADLLRHAQLQETIAQLQAMLVPSKLAAAQAHASQAQMRQQAAQGALPRTRAALAAKEKEVVRHSSGGTCGCLFKGRAERKHAEAEAAVSQLRQQLAREEGAAAKAAADAQEAQNQLAAWQGKAAELSTAQTSLTQLVERMFAGPGWRASPRHNAIQDGLRALESQAAEAGRHAQSFGRGAQLLQQAARGLQEALQALSRTQMLGAVNMGQGIGFQRRTGVNARRQPGRQFGNMAEMAVFRRANDGIAKAARDTAEAAGVLGPGMPKVDASVLSSARVGLLQNILIGGVVSSAIQLAAVRRSIEQTKSLLAQVQAALAWAQQNLGSYQQQHAALAAQVAVKQGELREFRQQALVAALAAATAAA